MKGGGMRGETAAESGLGGGGERLRADVERAVAALAALEEGLRPQRPAAAAELAALRAELMASLAALAEIERELGPAPDGPAAA
jgi:hypothetical protein